jgi:enoyl-[acyl-carrier protein] reductase III
MTISENKVALVTGSLKGIGRAIALKLAESGINIVINDKKITGHAGEQTQTLLSEIRSMGRQAIFVQADISQKKSVKELFEKTQNFFGRLDYLILNAAQAPFKPVDRLLERDLKQLVETNFLGNIFCIQESLPMLEKTAGTIIFISSLGSRFYNPSYPLGSMKAAMESIVRDCAERFRKKKISVNAVCGGIVKTDSLKVLRQHWDDLDKLPEDLFVEPSEIADVVLFFCSSSSSAVHGQTLVVDKGLSNTLFHVKDKS